MLLIAVAARLVAQSYAVHGAAGAGAGAGGFDAHLNRVGLGMAPAARRYRARAGELHRGAHFAGKRMGRCRTGCGPPELYPRPVRPRRLDRGVGAGRGGCRRPPCPRCRSVDRHSSAGRCRGAPGGPQAGAVPAGSGRGGSDQRFLPGGALCCRPAGIDRPLGRMDARRYPAGLVADGIRSHAPAQGRGLDRRGGHRGL